MSPRLPQQAGEVTSGWLSEALRREVSLLRAEPIGPIDGVNSLVSRLRLRELSGETSTLVFKVPARAEGARSVAAYQRWYERELGFYQHFAATAPIETPAVYFARIEADGSYALLLEDLASTPQGDQIAGCSADAAAVAVSAAADLHARFWDAPQLDGHDWLPATTVGLDKALAVAGAFARGWEALRASVDPTLRPRIDAAVAAYPALLEGAARPPVTLIHGDYRLDNMFLAADGSGLAVIDWQFIARCRGVYDVAYFLGLSLDPQSRRDHERRLLELYRERLAAGGVVYSDAAIEQDYRLGLLLSYAVFAIGALGQDPGSRSGRMHELGLRRLGAAILDHGDARPP